MTEPTSAEELFKGRRFDQEITCSAYDGRLVQDHEGETLTKQELDTLHATCLEIYMCLSQKVESLQR